MMNWSLFEYLNCKIDLTCSCLLFIFDMDPVNVSRFPTEASKEVVDINAFYPYRKVDIRTYERGNTPWEEMVQPEPNLRRYLRPVTRSQTVRRL
jgi:hypothetical protein